MPARPRGRRSATSLAARRDRRVRRRTLHVEALDARQLLAADPFPWDDAPLPLAAPPGGNSVRDAVAGSLHADRLWLLDRGPTDGLTPLSLSRNPAGALTGATPSARLDLGSLSASAVDLLAESADFVQLAVAQELGGPANDGAVARVEFSPATGSTLADPLALDLAGLRLDGGAAYRPRGLAVDRATGRVFVQSSGPVDASVASFALTAGSTIAPAPTIQATTHAGTESSGHLAVLPTGELFGTSGSADGRVWRLADGTTTTVLDLAGWSSADGPQDVLVFGSFLYVLDADGRVGAWQLDRDSADVVDAVPDGEWNLDALFDADGRFTSLTTTARGELLVTTAAGADVPAGLFAFAAQSLVATKTDALVGDLDGDGVTDPGETLGYELTIENTGGSDATNVTLVDELANLTLVDGSLNVGPLAGDDAYVAFGNTAFASDDPLAPRPSLFANDREFLGDVFSLVAFDAVSDAGGDVQVAADGRFTYLPPTGFTGRDRFSYTISDGTFAATASVTLTVRERIWYVDNRAAPGGDGRSTDPFAMLAEAVAAAGPGDTLYIRHGDGTDAGLNAGLVLQDRQRLVGEGSDLAFDGVTLVAGDPSRKPLLTNAGGSIVTLAADNVVRGLTLGDRGGTALTGGGARTSIVVEGVSIVGTGQALALSDAVLNVSLDEVRADDAAGDAISLSNVAGMLRVLGTTTISEPLGAAIVVTDSAGAATFDFGRTTIVDSDASSGSAIMLLGNAGSLTRFAGLDVTVANGAGVSSFDGGRLRVDGAANQLVTDGGPAVFLLQTQLDGRSSFRRIESLNNGGLNFVDVTGGSFAVDDGDDTTFDLVVANSPNAVLIQNSTTEFAFGDVEADDTFGAAIEVGNSTGAVTVRRIDLANSLGAGLLLNGAGDVAVGGGDITGALGPAVAVRGGAGVVWYGGTIHNSTGLSLEITGRTGGSVLVTGDTTDTGDGVLLEDNTGGTVTLAGRLTLSTGDRSALTIENNPGTTIRLAGTLDVDTAGSTAVLAMGGAAALEITAEDNTIDAVGGIGLVIDATPIGPAGVRFRRVSVASGEAGLRLNDTGAGSLTITGDGTADSGGVLDVSGDGVQLSNVASASLTNVSVLAGGVGLAFATSGTHAGWLTLTGSRITGGTDRGVDLDAGDDSTLVAALTGNVLAGPVSGFDAATLGAGSHACLALDANDSAEFTLAAATGTFDIVDLANVASANTGSFTFLPSLANFSDSPGCTPAPTPSSPAPLPTPPTIPAYVAPSEAEEPETPETVDSPPPSLSPSPTLPFSPSPSLPLSLTLPLGTLPAGKRLTIAFRAVVDSPFTGLVPEVSNQASVTADGLGVVLTDDPDTPALNDPTLTPLDTLSLGDVVWNDVDNSSTRTPDEPGLDGVTVQLFRDTDASGDWSAADVLVGETETAGGGAYRFDDLFPGAYVVRLPESNFQAGGPLAGLFSSGGRFNAPTDPDDDRDDVDDGHPVANGVAGRAATLAYNTEPTTDGDADADTNWTYDFGLTAVHADMAVSVTAPTVAIAGAGTAEVTITVSNLGPDAATGVQLDHVLTLPADVTLDSILPAAGTFTGTGGTGQWTLGTLPASGTATLTLTLSVPSHAQAALAAIRSTTTLVALSEPESNPANDAATADVSIARESDLAVTLSESADPAIAGAGDVTYVVTVTNRGPSDASDVAVSNVLALPAGATVVSGGGDWLVGDLAAGASATRNVVVRVASSTADGATITLDATLEESEETRTNLDDDAASISTTVVREVDLVVTLSESADPVVAGAADVTYVVRVTNRGPSDASAVAVSNVLALPVGATVVAGGGDWLVGDLSAGAGTTRSLVVRVGSSVVDGATITLDSAIDDAAETRANFADDAASISTSVVREVDLAVTLSESADPVVAGAGDVTYVVTVTNRGPSDASAVTVTNVLSLPAGATVVSGGGDWLVGDLTPGASATRSLVIRVGSSVADRATITLDSAIDDAAETRTNLADDAASISTTVVREVDLAVSLSESADPVVAGAGDVTYVVTATNRGPSDASAVTVTNVLSLPAGATVVSGDGDWLVGDLTPSASATRSIVVRVGSSVADGAAITLDSAIDDSAETRTNLADDATSISTTVVREVDLAVSLSESADPVVAGAGEVTYVVTVTNRGPSDTGAVAVSNVLSLPAGATVITGGGDWLVGDLSAGASATRTLVVRVGSSVADGATISLDSAIDDAAETRTNLADDAGSISTTVVREIDLVVSLFESADPMVAGAGDLTYVVTATNRGPSDASAVAVTNVLSLPAGATIVSGGGTWLVGDLVSGASETKSLVVRVDSSVADGATITLDSAVDEAAETRTNLGDDAASISTTVEREVDLVVSLAESAEPVVAGAADLTYVVTVTNRGPSDASDVAVTNVLALPAGATVVSGGGDWLVGDLAAGTSAARNVVVRVGSSVANGATITLDSAIDDSAEARTNSGDDAASISTSVIREIDLAVTLSESADPVVAGAGDVSYVVTVTNRGPSDASAVAISNVLALPVGATVVSGDGDWLVGDVAAGASASRSVVVRVGSSVADGATITLDSAIDDSAETRTNLVDDAASISTTVVREIDLVATLSESVDPVVAGEGDVTYVVTVTNRGPSDASAVTVSNVLALPAGATVVSGGGDWLVGDLAAGANSTQSIVVRVSSSVVDGATITLDSAIDEAAETRTNLVDDAASISTTVVREVDLAVSLSESADPVVAGAGDVTYVVTVTNRGPSDASDVAVTNALALPAGATIVTGDGDWLVGDLAAGSSMTRSLVLRVGSSVADGAAITLDSAIDDSAESRTNLADDAASTSTTVVREVDLVVTLSESADPVVAGAADVTYVVTVTNRGPSDASDVAVSNVLALPSGATVVSGGGDWLVGDLTAGTNTSRSVVIHVGSSAADGATITLDSAIDEASETRTNLADDAASISTTVVREVDLVVTLSESADPVVAGAADVTFVVTVTNRGPSDASDVAVSNVLALPSGATVVSGGGDWLVGDLTAGTSATRNLVVRVGSSAADGATMTLDSAIDDSAEARTNLVDDAASISTSVVREVDLAVTLSESADPVVAGAGDVTYVVTVTNRGPSDASDVAVTNVLALPADATVVSGDGDWLVGDLAAGASLTRSIVVRVGSSVVDGATVTLDSAVDDSAETRTNLADDAPSISTTVVREVDLTVSLSESADPVVAGAGDVSYVVTVTNRGPSDASAVTVTNVLSLPAGATVVSGGGDWLVGDLWPGASATRSVVVRVGSSVADGAMITLDSAIDEAAESRTNLADDATSISTTVVREVDLAVSLTESADPVVAGAGEVTYVVTVTNRGPSDASDVAVTNALALPAGATIVTGDGDWLVGDLTAGTSSSRSVVIRVGSSAADGATITLDSAIDEASETRTNLADDAASISTTVVREVDLAVSLSESADPVVAGAGAVTYVVTVTNRGPSDASAVTVKNVLSLPAGATVVSGGGDWLVGDLVAGASATRSIVVRVGSSAAESATITLESAIDDSAETRTNLADDAASISTTVVREVDLVVTLSESADPVVAGAADLTYVVTMTNRGPSDASDVALTNVLALPAGATIVSGGGDWLVGDLTAGASATRRVVVRVSSSVADGATITLDSAIDDSAETRTNLVDDAASISTTVVREIDLVVTLSESADPVVAGAGELTFFVTVTNYGPSDASAVTVTNVLSLPSGATVVSGGGDWLVGDLAAGTSAARNVVVRVGSSSADGATITLDSAIDEASETRTNFGDDAASNSTTVVREVDLAVSLSESADPVVAGAGNVTYVVTVTNRGPSDASAVTVKNVLSLPAGATVVSGGGDWLVGDLVAGASATRSIVVRVGSSAAESATITLESAIDDSAETRTNLADDAASISTTIVREVDLVVTLSESADPVVAGAADLTYVVTVTNRGPSDASDVALTNVLELPAGATIVSGGGDWLVGDLTAGASATRSVVVRVSSSVADGATITLDSAIDEAAESRTNLVDDAASISTTVVREVDLVVSLSESADPVVAGAGDVTYVVTVENRGPSDASDVALTNVLALPAGATVVSGDGDWLVGGLTAGASATRNVVVRVGSSLADGATITLDAAIDEAVEARTNLADDAASISTTVVREVDLVVTLTESVDPVVAGEGTATFLVSVVNRGPSDADGVIVANVLTLPPGTRIADGDGDWLVGGLAAGAAAAREIAVVVDAAAEPGVDVIHVAAEIRAAAETRVRLADDRAEAATSIVREFDVELSADVSAEFAVAGTEDLRFTVHATNAGPSVASAVVDVWLGLPVGVRLEQSSGDGAFDPLLGRWTIEALEPGAQVTLELDLSVASRVVNGAIVSLAATRIANDESDVNLENDSAVANARVTRVADLAVTKVDDHDPVFAKGQVTYAITLTNAGPSDASDVRVTDLLPAELTLRSIRAESDVGGRLVVGAPEAGGVRLGGLPAGASVRVFVTADVADVASRSITNVVTVAASERDPRPENNRAEQSTEIAGLSRLEGVSFADPNDNGLQETGETGIAGTVIELVGVDIHGGTVHRIDISGPDGEFEFDDLPPGLYALTKYQPPLYVDGRETVGTLGGVIDEAISRITVVVPPDADGVDYRFAERGFRPEQIVSKRLFLGSTPEFGDLAVTLDLHDGRSLFAFQAGTDSTFHVAAEPAQDAMLTLYTREMDMVSQGYGATVGPVAAGQHYILTVDSGSPADSIRLVLQILKPGTVPTTPVTPSPQTPPAPSPETPPAPVVLHTNQFEPLDVDGSGRVTPLDALLVINALSRPTTNTDLVFLDTHPDGRLTPLDALVVIRRLNEERTTAASAALQANAEAEAEPTGPEPSRDVVSLATQATTTEESARVSSTATLPATSAPTACRLFALWGPNSLLRASGTRVDLETQLEDTLEAIIADVHCAR